MITGGSVSDGPLRDGLGSDYELVCACGDAAGLLMAHVPDLVIVDLDLPGERSIETCREVRAHAAGRSIPILFLAARKDDLTFLAALGGGADAVLSKPVDIPALLQRVRALLASYRA